MDHEQENLAQTLAQEMKAPTELVSNQTQRRVALPPNWLIKEFDDAALQPAPLRKKAVVSLRDSDSFISYVKRHGSLTDSTVWCTADYTNGKVDFTAIINDNGEDPEKAAWRDHKAFFSPEFSEEWRRWIGKNKHPFTQAEFAAFIEENLKDIASPDDSGFPAGSAMLEMAMSFEANQDMRFKSTIRLQNGGLNLQFVQDDDAQTLQKMQVFERFAIGIPVFWGGDAYQIDARLRYRVRDGKLAFWFELIRQDKVLEAAAITVIDLIKEKTGNPFFFGKPFFG